MTDRKTVARRSARTFEAEIPSQGLEKVPTSESTTSIRRKALAEEAKAEHKIEKELFRQSRNSSISASSETAMELQMDMMGNGPILDGAREGITRHEKTLRGKMDSRAELNFGNVIPDVYRAACPEPADHEFLSSLGLKTILSLADKERPEEYGIFIRENGIKHIVINMEGTKNGIPSDVMKAILSVALDKRNYPMLIHCNHGRHRTGCVVAIIRKVNGMRMESIIEEYRHFATPKPRDVDVEYIMGFSANLVDDVVHRTRFLSNLPLRTPAPTPLLTSKMAQLALGTAVVLIIWATTIFSK